MVVSLPEPLAKFGYGTFYLPATSYGYIYANPGLSAYQPELNTLRLFRYSVHLGLSVTLKRWHFLGLFLVSLVAAVQVHGIGRSIFGPDATESDRKLNSVIKTQLLSILSGIPAKRLPTGGKVKQMTSSPTGLVRFAQEFSSKMSSKELRHIAVRILFFLPALPIKWYFRAATVLLWVSVLGSADFSVVMLFGTHFTVHSRNLLWFFIPDPEADTENQNIAQPANANKERPTGNSDGRIDT